MDKVKIFDSRFLSDWIEAGEAIAEDARTLVGCAYALRAHAEAEEEGRKCDCDCTEEKLLGLQERALAALFRIHDSVAGGGLPKYMTRLQEDYPDVYNAMYDIE